MSILKKSVLLIISGIVLSVLFSFIPFQKNYNSNTIVSWEDQLNEMNYFVLKASSINIIQGLHLTEKQIEELKTLAKKFESENPGIPDTKGKVINDFVDIRNAYITLIDHLEGNVPFSDSLKTHILDMRIIEAELIKRTLLGSKTPDINNEKNCLKCHALPENFPKGDVTNKNTPIITDKMRVDIDVSHVKGLFNEDGMLYLWKIKSEVDNILTNGQKFMLKDFRCCLLPPGDLQDPANIGQAAVSNEWLDFFNEARALSDKHWDEYKQLFFYPVEDIIEATLPGIKKKNKTEIIKKIEDITVEARKLDKIDYEIQKEQLCIKIQDALNVDFLIGENDRQKEAREFLAAMFLLFPGSYDVYDKLSP